MEKEKLCYEKAKDYKSDALYWLSNANNHYRIFSSLLTTISITVLGFLTIIFSKDVSFTNYEIIAFGVLILASFISIIASIWQHNEDQNFFIRLTNDSSKRQSIWERENLTYIQKRIIILDLPRTEAKSNIWGIRTQMICLVIMSLCLLFVSFFRLSLQFNENNLHSQKYCRMQKDTRGYKNYFLY